MEESNLYNLESPFLALNYVSEFCYDKETYCTQGCKWSPDGSGFLAASSNNEMKVFNLPSNVSKGEFNDEKWLMGGWKEDIKPITSIKESDHIYDYQWYPLMKSENSNSACFAVTCRGIPIHLWSSLSGNFICSYIYFNHLDQLVSAHSLAFSNDGLKLIGGYNKGIELFEVNRPGRISTKISSQEQSGIISTIAFHPQLNNIFGAGSYNGSLGLYSLQTNQMFAKFEGQKKGITHIKFSADGSKLFSGTRNDDDIFCWDMRNPGEVFAVFKRHLSTNQKMYFDVTPDDQFLLSGTKDGNILVWDLDETSGWSKSDRGEILPAKSFKTHNDCVNGVSVHPNLPLLLTSSGQRVAAQIEDDNLTSDDSDNEISTTKFITRETSVKMWWIGQTQ